MGLLKSNIVSLMVTACLFSQVSSLQAAPPEVNAKHIFMIDAETNAVLYALAPDAPIQPASLAKLMTAELVFNALNKGSIKLDDEAEVSEHAWRTGGAPSRTATMFAKLKSHISIENLIQGLTVQNANDAAIILAEKLAGSESAFAVMMNERAKELGLTSSSFVNATGLPAEGQRTSLVDMVKLGAFIQQQYPEYYPYYVQESFNWNKIFQRNKNPLLKHDVGVDGLGFGFTQGVGYSAAISAESGYRRVYIGLAGAASDQERQADALALIDWAMTSFEDVKLFTAKDIVGQAALYGGVKSSLELTLDNDLNLLIEKDNIDRISASIIYDGPILAPVDIGEKVGVIKVWQDDLLLQEAPVYAAETVQSGDLVDRAEDALKELATGWIRKYL